MSEEKLVNFFERFAKLLYEGVELSPAEYEQRKKHLMEPALNLFKMVKEYVKDDSDLGAMIYLLEPIFFKAYPEREDFKEVKRSRALLLGHFNLTSKKLYNRASSLERKIERKYGEDWFAIAHFHSAYGVKFPTF